MLKPALVLSALAIAAAAQAAPEPEAYPKFLRAPGGEVVIPSAEAQGIYNEFQNAPARRAGDFLYISGVAVGPRPGDGKDAEALKAQLRRAFGRIALVLKAERLSFADVVKINTYHVWNSPNFRGSKDDQFAAFTAVRNEFVPQPHPAWTAVGVTGLFAEPAVMEIEMIAYAPQARPRP